MASTPFQDIDFYGEEFNTGSPKEYLGEDAVKNALKAYLLSDPGDYLYRPSVGGIVSQLLLKGMTQQSLTDSTLLVQRAIERDFTDIILDQVYFIPDYPNNLLELEISYTVKGSDNSSSLSVYYDQQFPQQNYNYEEIDYIEENLRNFCLNKKPTQIGETMGLDGNFQAFRWGKYIFINLLPTDPYFAEIFLICNSSS